MAQAKCVDEDFSTDNELAKALTESFVSRKDESGAVQNKRSIVLDEDNFEDTFLRCMVCRDTFTISETKTPKLLPCHHSFCVPCIQQLYNTEQEYRQNLTPALRGMPTAVSIHCPSCRGSFVTTEENLKQLPTDHRVIQLLDFLKHTQRYTVNFCSKHDLQPLHFFCEPCITPVCRDCTILDHKESEAHLVMDLDVALQKYTPVLDNAIMELDKESSALEEKATVLQTASENLDKARSELLAKIEETFSRLRTVLDNRQKELEGVAEYEINKEKSKLDEKRELLSDRRKTLMSQAKTLQKAKEDKQVEEMFSIHQEVREYRAGPPLKIREVDDGVVTTFSFNSRDEPILTSRISNFGDVGSQVESTYLRNGTKTRYPGTYRSLSKR
ncbi:tripartite motif-containing protein 2-like [Gigantopelta aegis]|uniref:tripartite motif-containing protein 2-like n=1 Tax=Gigantopelta aegis TaxID=1735272 RepID=UPI001B887FF5|nr:tripartite motif-containing protein 2-like [Gigantopelta aegis]XP_041364798.1 tripartite motif-containing protein 2-like [Gigantopelta aegis]XP_041364807.1 tripartite motif-containing protein 2-like [Gigantopelta aegis]